MSFVEIPIFEGFALRQWIDWMEMKFSRVRIPESWKLSLAKSLIEGEAKTYLNQTWLHLGSWDSLKAALLFRFGDEDDPERLVLLEKTREYDKRLDLTDHRFDQITQIRSRMDTNPILSTTNGMKSVADDPIQQMTMPRFNGSLPFGWLLRIEKYFQSCQVVEDERLGRLSECLEGEALFWFKKELFYGGFSSWSEFKRMIVARFAPVRRCSRQAMTPKPILMSRSDKEKESSPVNKSVEIKKTAANDSVQKLVVEVSQEMTPASQPLFSNSVLESCPNEKGVEDFGYILITMAPEQVVSKAMIVDDLPSEMDKSDEKSPGVLCTHSAYNVPDILPRKTDLVHLKMAKNKLSKSWRFKFKPIQNEMELYLKTVKTLECSSPTRLLKHVSTSEFVASSNGAIELIHVKGTVPAIDREEELVSHVSAVEEKSLVLQEEVVQKTELVYAVALETMVMQYMDSPAVEEFHQIFGSCGPLMLPDALVTKCSSQAVWITDESVQESVHTTELLCVKDSLTSLRMHAACLEYQLQEAPDLYSAMARVEKLSVPASVEMGSDIVFSVHSMLNLQLMEQLGKKKQFSKNWMFKYKDTKNIQVAKGLIQVLQKKLLISWRFKYKATKQHVNFLFLTSLCGLWNMSCSIWGIWRSKDSNMCGVFKTEMCVLQGVSCRYYLVMFFMGFILLTVSDFGFRVQEGLLGVFHKMFQANETQASYTLIMSTSRYLVCTTASAKVVTEREVTCHWARHMHDGDQCVLPHIFLGNDNSHAEVKDSSAEVSMFHKTCNRVGLELNKANFLVWHRWKNKAKTTQPAPELLTFGVVNQTKFFSVWHRWRIRDSNHASVGCKIMRVLTL